MTKRVSFILAFMPKALFLAIVGTVMLSCSSTYIYSTLDNANREIVKTETGDFFYENDSLWISYSFRGERAPIQITVFNKLEKALFIDWKKSLLVYNGIKHSFQRAEIVFTGNEQGEPYVNNASVSKQWMDNTLKTPQHVSYIPPLTLVSCRTFDLTFDLGRYRRTELNDITLKDKKGKNRKEKGLIFTYSDSPLQLSSYVNTFYDKPDDGQVCGIDFYVFSIIKSNSDPVKTYNNMQNRGDMLLYKRKPSYRFWKSLGKGAAISGLTLTTVAVDAYLNRED